MSMSKFSTFTNVDYPLTPKIPEHWRALPCRAFVAEKVEKNNDGIEREYLSLMSNVGVIRYSEKGDVGNKAPDDLTKCKVVEKGNLVINSMNYSIGSYGISPYDGVCSPVYIVLEPITSVVLRRFALRIFENKEFQNWAQSFGSGILAHRAAIGWDDLKNIIVGIPPLGEQQKIAQFLDHETAKIDALIAEQERLIELLQEKRQAVISHAVTKGLDPNVPMKDSGVEWLGEVPEHWSDSKLGYVARLTTGATPSTKVLSNYSSQDKPWYRPDDLDFIPQFRASTPKLISQSAFSQLRLIPATSSLVCCIGSIGKLAYLTEAATTNQQITAAIPNSRVIDSKFLFWCLAASQSELDLLAVGNVVKILNSDRLAQLRVSLPTLPEQTQIARFLDRETGKLDELVNQASKSIELMKERRSALISAAVTGKIDVRDWQPPIGSDTVDSDESVQMERQHG